MNTKNFWDAVNDLSSKLFKVYSVINKLADNDAGYCYASNDGIGAKAKKHPVNISKDISELIDLGYLFSIELKDGFITKERRLYTAENLKTYMQDKKNFENLLKTFTEEVNEIIVFYNERNPHPKKHNLTVSKNANGAVSENANGAVSENAKVTILSNLSKTELSEEPSESASVKKVLSKREKVKIVLETEEIELDYAFITELCKKYNFLTIVDLVRSIDKKADSHGAYLRKIIKEKGFDKVIQSEPKEVAPVLPVEVPNVVDEIKKEVQSREKLITEYLTAVNIKDVQSLDKFNKENLNNMLRRSGYELCM